VFINVKKVNKLLNRFDLNYSMQLLFLGLQGRCLKFLQKPGNVSEYFSWHTARQLCWDQGYDLAVLETQDLIDVVGHLEDKGLPATYAYIGLSIGGEGQMHTTPSMYRSVEIVCQSS
jgi:hypothetical protein